MDTQKEENSSEMNNTEVENTNLAQSIPINKQTRNRISRILKMEYVFIENDTVNFIIESFHVKKKSTLND